MVGSLGRFLCFSSVFSCNKTRYMVSIMFKDTFKYYKSKKPPPELGGVLDFYSIEGTENKVKRIPIIPGDGNTPIFFGFTPINSWEVYEIMDHPGLLFIKNPFTTLGQRYWTVRCLKDYTKRPNKSNLVPDNVDWWEMCQNNNVLLNKLRWITLGYHHNWDTKVYSENNKDNFPRDLKDMTSFLAEILGYNDFSAEAAIVNYYHMDSTLSGHTDHSERNLEAPLFSFSFGQTAIFLIGGKFIEDIAIPMFLRSGDIVVMSKESRLCYHGVPKILQVDSKMWCSLASADSIPREYNETVSVCKDEALWRAFGDYLSHSRINMNVRQVLYNGEKQLN